MKAPPIFIISGMPSGGTTYLCAVLHNPPKVITVSEAGGGWKQKAKERGKDPSLVKELFDYRERVLDGEEIPSLEGTEGFSGMRRVDTWNQKKKLRRHKVDPSFSLGMKQPEVFLELLEFFLEAGLKCVLSVRHPLYVINSWVKRSERQLEQKGHLRGIFANGESVLYSSAKPDIVDRRIDLYNHMAARAAQHMGHEDVMLIRYEEWFTDKNLLDKVSDFIGIPNLGYLRPPLIPPDPLLLGPEEQGRILAGCAAAAELGYETGAGKLLPVAIHP
jgi:hypothetical protein